MVFEWWFVCWVVAGSMGGVLYAIAVLELRTQSDVVWGPALAILAFGN